MLTRQGWGALLGAATAFAVGRVFGLIELFVVGTGLVAAVAYGLLTVRRRLPQVGVQRIARPATVAVGEPARVDIQITNLGRWRTPHLQLWEPVGDKGGAPMQLAPLAPGEAANAAYRVPTSRRGVLQTGPLRAQHRDVLGLSTRTTYVAGIDEVLVVPAHVHLAFPAVGSAGRLGQHLRMKAWGQTGGEFHSMREYVPGDDLRRINWKASARSEELMVRETALDGVRRCTVVLDTSAGEYHADSFEQAVSAAASVVSSAAGANVATRLVSFGIDSRGPDVVVRSLRWLATCTASAEPFDASAIGRGAGEGIGVVVLVTGTTSSPAVSALGSSIGPDESLIVISCTEPPHDGRFVADGTTSEHLFQSWNALVNGRAATVVAT